MTYFFLREGDGICHHKYRLYVTSNMIETTYLYCHVTFFGCQAKKKYVNMQLV